MYDWINQHESVINVLINVGILLIWLIYAQLLYLGFRRQRRPRVIINRGKRNDIEALCIISNMSAEAVYIEYIIARLETSHGTINMNVTEFEQEYSEEDEHEHTEGRSQSRRFAPNAIRDSTRQGPLDSGDFIHIGKFGDLVHRLARSANIEMRDHRPLNGLKFRRLTIRLVLVYGSEDEPVSVSRSFDFYSTEKAGEARLLVPVTWDTRRSTSLWQRLRLRKELDAMNRTNFSFTTNIRDPKA